MDVRNSLLLLVSPRLVSDYEPTASSRYVCRYVLHRDRRVRPGGTDGRRQAGARRGGGERRVRRAHLLGYDEIRAVERGRSELGLYSRLPLPILVLSI